MRFAAPLRTRRLPLGVFGDDSDMPRVSSRQHSDKQEKPEPAELAVAFLRFVIDGVPAAETHFLTPGEAHDLEVEVRVSRWPEHANTLRLTPVTIELKSSYEFPDFEFARPTGDPPFRMEQRQRAMLRVPQWLTGPAIRIQICRELRTQGVRRARRGGATVAAH